MTEKFVEGQGQDMGNKPVEASYVLKSRILEFVEIDKTVFKEVLRKSSCGRLCIDTEGALDEVVRKVSQAENVLKIKEEER